MGRLIWGVALLIAVLAVPAPALAWDIPAARQYAHDYWDPPNDNFPYLSGNNCAGYVSQCLHAHAAKDVMTVDPILGYAPPASKCDSAGVDWYFAGGTGNENGWYCFWVNDDNPDNWAYTYSYSFANKLHYYMRDNPHFQPYRSLIGTYDYKKKFPPRDVSAMGAGAVISYDEKFYERNDGVFYAKHVAFVVHDNSHVNHDANNPLKGDLVNEHTATRWHVLWQKEGVHTRAYCINWKVAAWKLDTALD